MVDSRPLGLSPGLLHMAPGSNIVTTGPNLLLYLVPFSQSTYKHITLSLV